MTKKLNDTLPFVLLDLSEPDEDQTENLLAVIETVSLIEKPVFLYQDENI